MAYIRCEACGAKALVAASRCPTCAHEFQLVNGRGDRMKLARCRGCGIMHRPDRACHWCPPSTRRAWPSLMVRQAAAAALAFAVVGTAAWRYGDGAMGALTRAMDRSEPAPAQASMAATGAARTSGTSESSPAAPMASTDAALAATTAVAAVDSASGWTPVVARTWVNVRSDARRDGSVVGIIKPSERALLGEGRGRWRRVKLPDAEGWVNGRLFAPDSTDGRGA